MNTDFTIGYIYCGVALISALILFFDAYTIASTYSRHSNERNMYWAFITAAFASIFDCAFPLREMHIIETSQSMSYVVTLVYVLCSNLCGMFWIVYSEKKQNSWFTKSKKNFYFLSIPFCLILIAIISTPVTHCYFYFENNHYQRGPLFTILSVILLAYSLQNGLSALVRSHKKTNYANRKELRRLFWLAFIYVFIQIAQLGLPNVFPYRSVGIMLILNAVIQLNLRESIGTDSLTHISNRSAAERFLDKMMNEQTRFEVAIIDVDKFKKINDTYGHVEGDHALQIIAEALKQSVSRSCFIARMGGDEFILVNSEPQHSIEGVEEIINQNLALILKKHNREYPLTVSVGTILKDDNVNSIPETIKLADAKLYVRKHEKQ